MKLAGFTVSVSFLFCVSQALAQDGSPTPEQEAAIRAIAEEVNAACATPTGPEIPDGNTATEDAMVSTQQALKAYIENGNTYLGCLEEVETGWGEEISDNQAAVVNFLYNRMVSDLQTRAQAFNTALGVYREKAAE